MSQLSTIELASEFVTMMATLDFDFLRRYVISEKTSATVDGQWYVVPQDLDINTRGNTTLTKPTIGIVYMRKLSDPVAGVRPSDDVDRVDVDCGESVQAFHDLFIEGGSLWQHTIDNRFVFNSREIVSIYRHDFLYEKQTFVHEARLNYVDEND